MENFNGGMPALWHLHFAVGGGTTCLTQVPCTVFILEKGGGQDLYLVTGDLPDVDTWVSLVHEETGVPPILLVNGGCDRIVQRLGELSPSFGELSIAEGVLLIFGENIR